MSWRDYLCMLLGIGAEIEHAQLVQYLFAAYSLGGDQVPAAKRHEVRRWQDMLLTIAREEMGHLVSVQNLLTLVGGPVCFNRRNIPFDTDYFPFPFQLRALDMETITRYVYAEMPPEMASDASAEDVRVANAVVRRLKVPESAGRVHHVGTLYEKLIELVGDESRIPDETFRAGTYCAQASFAEWGKGYMPETAATLANPSLDPKLRRPYGRDAVAMEDRKATVVVAQMATRTDALAGLRQIAAQGEAPHLAAANVDSGDEPSHFDRFAEIWRGIEARDAARKPWTYARDVAANPTANPDLRRSPRHSWIESETSRSWAQLFNLRYRMALMWMTFWFRLSGGDSGAASRRLRGMVLHRIFGEMYNMKTCAGILVRSPLTADRADPRRAGPPFEMPYTLVLPESDADCWVFHRELLRESTSLCAELLRADRAPDSARALTVMQAVDSQGIEWIDRVLAGLGAGREGVRR